MLDPLSVVVSVVVSVPITSLLNAIWTGGKLTQRLDDHIEHDEKRDAETSALLTEIRGDIKLLLTKK